MNEPAVPNEQPPYWSTCESMNLTRLGMFIHDALIRQSEPKVPTDGSTPLSRPEFFDLVGLMQAKADALKEDTTISARPVYSGPEAPPFDYYADGLGDAYSRKDEAVERLEDAYRYDYGEHHIRQRRRELKEARREITTIEAEAERKEEEYRQRLHEYRQAREPYERELSAWKREVARVNPRREANNERQILVNRAHRKVAEAFKPKHDLDLRGLITRNFEIAGPDEQGDEHVRAYFRQVMGDSQLEGEWSQDRFDKMVALPRSHWQKGKAGFYGYMVIEFDHTEKVVLESPVEGHAIYVLDSNEDSLLAKNKRQLRESGKAKRIFHSGNDWYQRLKDEMGIE